MVLIMSHSTDETMEVKANGGAKQQTVKEENKKLSVKFYSVGEFFQKQ